MKKRRKELLGRDYPLQKLAEATSSSHLSLPPSFPPSMRDPASSPSRYWSINSGITYNDNTNYRGPGLPPGLPARELERAKKTEGGGGRGPISRNFLPNDVISRATRRSRDSSNSDPVMEGAEWTGLASGLGYLNCTGPLRVFNDPPRWIPARGRGELEFFLGSGRPKNRAAGNRREGEGVC